MPHFFHGWRPNLGGCLAMANCAAWLVFVISLQFAPVPDDPVWFLIIGIEVILGFPLGWLAIPGHTCGVTTDDIYWAGFVVGLNSFVWGYMIAAILKRSFKIENTPVDPQPPE